jgi:hypothetical protein
VVAHEDRNIFDRGVEHARLQQNVRKIAPDLVLQLAEPLIGERHDVQTEGIADRGDDAGQDEAGRSDLKIAEADRLHHGQLALQGQPVVYEQDRAEQGERQDHEKQRREQQQRQIEEGRNRETLVDNQVDEAQGLRQPDRPGEGQRREQRR